MTVLPGLTAFIVCWLVLAGLLRRSDRLPMDHPNARSLHTAPTPRIGGVGILAGVLAASPWLFAYDVLPIVLGALALAGVSLLDDVRGLSVRVRFLAHFVAAGAVLLGLGVTDWAWLAGVFAVVWMTNLYNFMDGSNGLAGGMAVIGFGALGLAAGWGGAMELAALCIAIAAAALAFLRFNFPLARLFMGDAGSIPLGFLAAVIGLAGMHRGLWSGIFPLLVFSPFIVDASVTLMRRLLAGEKFWQAHRSHYYQRVILLGTTHRQLAVAAWGLMLVMAGLAWVALVWPQHAGGVLILSGVLYGLLFLIIDLRWQRARHEP
jgi:UDP-N-acetylmuramyl pentapeptide phosphotransferase/UDP-N-acetylglucosamine-1-phosphate transferase